ncbi:unnamed protein product [Rangifer tarandus platyrhynchus]|uniref:Uncharacterized protein n=1 Tax=Rangifer tarandus platyrhynchus TaxID=3082113 RepID=A0AC59Z6E4_RANTA
MEGAESQTLRGERPCSLAGRPTSPPPAEDWLLPRPAVPSALTRPPASWAPFCREAPQDLESPALGQLGSSLPAFTPRASGSPRRSGQSAARRGSHLSSQT